MTVFAKEEYAARIKRAQTMMSQAGLDALLLTTEPEVRYFTGYLTRFWESPCRPWFLVVPALGDPIAVIPSIGAELMASHGIKDIRTWPAPQPEDEGVSLLIDALAQFPTVGTPMGQQSSLRMPLADWAKLNAAHPIRDDAGIVRRLRLVKSDAEIAKIRKACAIADAAFAQVPSFAQPGALVSQVYRDFQSACLHAGADWVPYLAGAADQHGYGDVISPASDTPLQNGDVLMLDTGLVHDGYFCDFDRNWSIGPPQTQVATGHNALFDATQAAFAATKPGAKASDLWRAMADIVGATETGRLGHGLGMSLTEWPSLTAQDHTELVPGMVLTLEPSIEIAPGKLLVCEENVVVTATGADWLSTPVARDIMVIA